MDSIVTYLLSYSFVTNDHLLSPIYKEQDRLSVIHGKMVKKKVLSQIWFCGGSQCVRCGTGLHPEASQGILWCCLDARLNLKQAFNPSVSSSNLSIMGIIP